jgi:hypothetical protein
MEIAGDPIYIPLYPSNSRSSTELMASQDFSDRPSNKLVLFDVDGTLTPARQVYLIPLTTFTVTHEH